MENLTVKSEVFETRNIFCKGKIEKARIKLVKSTIELLEFEKILWYNNSNAVALIRSQAGRERSL